MIRIIYHGADLDGISSAAIVVRDTHRDFTLHPADYGKLPDLTQFGDQDTVYVLDFSFPPKEMAGLARRVRSLIWIDHHASAIREAAESEYAGMLERLPGIRRSGQAACVLTWEWVHADDPVPLSIKLLGEYDVWRHDDPDTLPFQHGMRYMDLKPDSPEWEDLLSDYKDLSEILDMGLIVMRHDRQMKKRAVSAAFLSVIHGMKVLALNGTGGSEAFKDASPELLDKAEALLTFIYDGKTGRWRYGLYHAPGHEDLDLSRTAAKYGGGGHRGACGFQHDDDLITPSRLAKE